MASQPVHKDEQEEGLFMKDIRRPSQMHNEGRRHEYTAELPATQTLAL